jgi:sugar/nucleoside kinase (ribokinase family)
LRGEEIIDTTGAGDLWAAGFLYGLAQGLPIETCGRLASACGYEVCRVLGATIPDTGWQRIRGMIELPKRQTPVLRTPVLRAGR